MHRVALSALFALFLFSGSADAQILPSGSQGGTRVPTLNETLVNSLKATLPEQQKFIKNVVEKTDEGKLDKALVFAVMRYAQRRNAQFPFPFFEKAIRYQASKKGVALPAVATIVTSRTKTFR